jgi:tripartite-type tricarboxylate transporter receptor subunit TctC
MSRKTAFVAALLSIASVFLTPITAAAYPEKVIRIIVPWPPGPTDTIARFVSTDLGARLKQQVIVDNRPGAGGIVGMQIAAASPPDGYTLMVTSTAYGYLIARPKVNVDLIDSFTPVALLGLNESLLVVHPSMPVKTVKELIALAKAHPGTIRYASSGVGGFPHMNTELFKLMAHVDLVHVPYKGAGPAITELLGGQTQMILTSMIGLIPHVNAGKLRPLGVGSLKRSPRLPDVPTISEAGVPGYETSIWYGMFGPAGLPSPIVDQLNSEVAAVLATADLRKRYEPLAVEIRNMTPAEYAKFMVSEANKWMKVVKEAGIKGE